MRHRPRLLRSPGVAVLAVSALVVSACSEGERAAPQGEPGAGIDNPAAATAAPQEPSETEEGCGAQAVTDPANLDAARVVARCAPGLPEPVPLPERASLRVAVPEVVGEELAPLLLADALGELEAENIEVELVPAEARAAMAALEAGEVDLVAGDIDAPFLDAVHRGDQVRQVLGGVLSRAPNDYTVAQAGLWVRSAALENDEIADLELLPVGVPDGPRAAAVYPLSLVLGQAAITLNEVGLFDVQGSEAAEILMREDVAGAWLDGASWHDVARDDRFELVATLPASEAIRGTVFGERLLGPDRAVGVAYVRAIIRTINTHLSGDYRADGEVMRALATATDGDEEVLAGLPPLLYDWEVRAGTLARQEEAWIDLGGVVYDQPLASDRLVDRTFAADAIGGEPR